MWERHKCELCAAAIPVDKDLKALLVSGYRVILGNEEGYQDRGVQVPAEVVPIFICPEHGKAEMMLFALEAIICDREEVRRSREHLHRAIDYYRRTGEDHLPPESASSI